MPAHAASVCHAIGELARGVDRQRAGGRDRVRPRRDRRLARRDGLQRVAVDLPRVRLVLGQHVEAAVAVVAVNLKRPRTPAASVFIAGSAQSVPEVALAVRVRVERLRVVVAVRGALDGAVAEPAAGERRPDRAVVAAAASARRAAMIAARRRRGRGRSPAASARPSRTGSRGCCRPCSRPRRRSRLNPCLSIRSHVTSHSVAAQPWPRPCGSASDVPLSQPLVLIESYVNGWIVHVARVRTRPDAGAAAVGLEERVRAHAARALRVVEARVEQQRHARGSRSSPRPPARCRSGSLRLRRRRSGGSRRHGRTRG